MNKSSPTELKAEECYHCQGKAEYFCRSCKQDLCELCKEEHMIDFDTKHHDVVIDRLKYRNFVFLETCSRHPHMFYEMWCLMCKLPFCLNCEEHIYHETRYIKSEYKSHRDQNQERIFHVKSETMLHNRVIQARIDSDFRSCQNEISRLRGNMIIKAERLKDKIDVFLEDIEKQKCYVNSKRKQQRRHVRSMQKRVHRSEQLANRAIQFISFSKKNNFYKHAINDTTSILLVNFPSLSLDINKNIVFGCLSGVSIIGPVKREIKNQQLFKVINPPVLKKTFAVKPTCVGDSASRHISCVSPDFAWINSWKNLNLTDTKGDNLSFLSDKSYNNGIHAVTKEGNLVYIDRKCNIKKLSLNNETMSTLMRIAKPWKPYCLYCSPLNGDFLIGMIKQDKYIAKVARYNYMGQKLQHNPGQGLYVKPRYITENQNEDVIVSDVIDNVSTLGVIVVTDSVGTHRFTYTGSPQGSKFKPHGICTDALSHILVCDSYTRTVQMIDKDGQFLTVLLTEQQVVEYPYSLSYDHKSHLLWVGSLKNTVICIYRHIQRHDYLKKQLDGVKTRRRALTDTKGSYSFVLDM